MTKVEELRNEVVSSCDPRQRDSVVRVLDSLIAAARADERKRIWDRGVTQMMETDDGPHRVFVADASVVDPKKVQQ